MILINEIEIVLSNKTISYYKKLGYDIPLNKYNRISRGTKITIKLSDILKGSNIKILCKCDICGIERLLYYNLYRNICH